MGVMRVCIESRCPELVEAPASRCPAHESAHHQADVTRRGSAAERGYDAAWVAVRDQYAREHPLCEDHQERGETVPMQVVDHVIPLPDGPRLDPRNFRSLCNSCHAVKSARDRARGAVANVAPAAEVKDRPRWIVA